MEPIHGVSIELIIIVNPTGVLMKATLDRVPIPICVKGTLGNRRRPFFGPDAACPSRRRDGHVPEAGGDGVGAMAAQRAGPLSSAPPG